MYLVDLGSGKEAVFDSGNELAAAIRRGDVGWHSRIYHRARATWLPITVHPEFRRVASERPGDLYPPAGRRRWTFMPAEADTVTAPRSEEPPDPPVATPSSTRTWRQTIGSALRFWGGPRRA